MKQEKQPKPMKPDHYDPIAAALKEDIGAGDITTEFFVPEGLHARDASLRGKKRSTPAQEQLRKFSGRSTLQRMSRLIAAMAMTLRLTTSSSKCVDLHVRS